MQASDVNGPGTFTQRSVNRERSRPRPWTVGHRGASALAPENSLRAFELAIEHGLDLAELDVHLSRDGELMVIHDADLTHVAGRPVNVAELTATELGQVDVGDGRGVPRLVDVFELAHGCLGVYVELKGPRTGAALGELVRMGAAEGLELIGGSFHPELVAELREAAPAIPRSVLFPRRTVDEMVAICRSLNATYAHPCFRPVDHAMVEALHQAGLLVMTPHTNDPAEAREFAHLGVDVIASDDPRVLAGLSESDVGP
ncbi:MAG: glycerophosphodiester phosphodiesterase [Chloroflexi bacterium]|nr:glycerophosphodiester phosphodiesterase [Chloroflexota bacterium]